MWFTQTGMLKVAGLLENNYKLLQFFSERTQFFSERTHYNLLEGVLSRNQVKILSFHFYFCKKY